MRRIEVGLEPDEITRRMTLLTSANIEPSGLPQWKWPPMGPYNGFTHEERVRGWQCIWWLMENGVMPKPEKCAISGATKDLHHHCEDYYHPWTAVVLTQPVHLALHRRFIQPAAWLAIVEGYSMSGDEWFASLAFERVDLASQLRTELGDGVCDVFAHATETFPSLTRYKKMK